MTDALRLAVGLLTAIPVGRTHQVGPRGAGLAMALAPVAVVPLGLLVAFVCWGGRELGLAPLAVAAVAVGALALGSRAFHLDGLADTADGLTSSYDRERALAVMKTGDVGPAGAAALVVVLGIQIASLAAVLTSPNGPWLAAALVVASRGAVAITCLRGVPGARSDGLGSMFDGSVKLPAAALVWLILTALACAGFALVDESWWRGLVAVVVALVVVAVVVQRAVTRLGGVTGDVFGAAIELSLAALLLAAS